MKKVLFIDRDGTLIREPADHQVDSLGKLALVDGVIPALLLLKEAGYRFVIVTNQDGLGTESFSQAAFDAPNDLMIALFRSQGIVFDAVLICPHHAADRCLCRKPHLGLVRPLLTGGDLDLTHSAVLGDRETDMQLAANLGVKGVRIDQDDPTSWRRAARELTGTLRRGAVVRRTRETTINVAVELDGGAHTRVNTGIGYLDHMLEQLSCHGGFDLSLTVDGDLHVDEHHTIEDTALALGEALRRALGDKVGIGRYGFVLPLDEAVGHAVLDLSGRPLCVFKGQFPREKVGSLPTDLVPHFFRSLATAMAATLHVSVTGEDTHHMVESCFKAVARCLRQACAKQETFGSVPSTKGVL